jgi:hypothetical protein
MRRGKGFRETEKILTSRLNDKMVIKGLPDCEYKDICEYAGNSCLVEERSKCPDWHDWKLVDLIHLFQYPVDCNRNYTLNL